MIWTVTLECTTDGCPSTVTSTAPYQNAGAIEAGAVRDLAQTLGWTVKRNHRGRDLCPQCVRSTAAMA